MKIAANAVVSFEYTLKDGEGELIDQSTDSDPMVYLHGRGQIVPGLEAALEGKSAGDHVQAVVAPKDGYGESDGREEVRIPRTELPDDLEPEEGMALHAEGPDGGRVTLWVVKIEPDTIVFSPDHPLVGVTLHFDVKVREVRGATAQELAHGHVHGPGGAHD